LTELCIGLRVHDSMRQRHAKTTHSTLTYVFGKRRAAEIRTKRGKMRLNPHSALYMSEDPGGSGKPASPEAPGRADPESTFHLLDRARAGDERALERLFERHLKPLQRWARGRLPGWARDLAETDDLVQETLVQTFKRIEGFEPRRVGALQAYLRQAILNRIRDELRRKRRRPDITELNGLEVDRAESPLEQAIGREAVDRYESALTRLRPEEREAIIARVELGYNYEELAEALGKPTADAARKAAQRALSRLAEKMKRGSP
jgi:RNA polymerase sigma factor (sigma-70 family)